MAQDLPSNDGDFAEEIQQLCVVLCSDASDVDPTLAARLCVAIRRAVSGAREGQRLVLTLRSFERLISSAAVQHQQQLSFSEALVAAVTLTLLPQLEAGGSAARAVLEALQLVLPGTATPDLGRLTHLPDSVGMLGEHVLTPSRRAHVKALLSCMDCRLPVLLVRGLRSVVA